MLVFFFLNCKLSFFRFTNNILSTAQQIWLRKLGGAKPAVSGDAGGIISAGRAKRTAQPVQTGERLLFQLIRLFSLNIWNTKRVSDVYLKSRMKQLKEEENRKMFNKALAVEGQTSASTSISDDESDGESNDKVCRYSYASFSL